MTTLHPLLHAYQPTAGDPFDRLKAAHLLNRAGLGGTAAEIDKVVQLGPQKAVDWLLDFPEAGADEQSPTDLPDLSGIGGDYPRTFRELRKRMAGKSEEEKKALRKELMKLNREALEATAAWWLKRLAYGPHPLQEKLTLFWHGHFTTSAKDERSAKLMWDQNELLRRFAAGNFAQFLRAISRNPAMLDYLNNQQNRKEHPNENYARELMELFTLGIGNYTETDVKEGARAFTGWAHDGDNYIFRRREHDYGDKRFLGRRGNFNGDDILEIILQQPVCAVYVSSKLYNFFVSETVAPDIAANLGNVLRDNRYELRPLLRTIFTSKIFYSPEVIGSQIKSPVQLVMGTIRLLGLDMPPNRRVVGVLKQMGQVPLNPPNVKGWPGGRAWINTSTLFVRYNTALQLAGGGRGRRGRIFAVGGGASAEALVDQWVGRLIQRPVEDAQRQVLLAALGAGPANAEAVRRMVQLIVSMPEYQLC
jgi:hypothetical protein